MKKFLFIWIALSSYLFSEPSAFSAGDLSVSEPYGLTPNEKLLLKNIDTVKHLKRDKNVINSDVDQLKSDLEGFRSVLSGLTQSRHKIQKLLKKILEVQDGLEVSSLEHQNALSSLDANISALISLQNKNYEKIKANFTSLDERVGLLEKKYVTKKSFDALQLELTQFRTLVSNEFKKLNGSTSKKSHKKSAATIYKEGRNALKAKKYKTAATRFMRTIELNYKPASSHFYAGEAYYKQKRYSKAISFYKESYRRYKKARYNARLFLHMGISLDKLGKKAKAKKVFKTLIKKYPKSSYAKQAKKYL